MQLKKDQLTLSKTYEGAWSVSAIVGGYLTQRLYYGYTKQEAANRYLSELNKKGN
jgi:hypothetical protein